MQEAGQGNLGFGVSDGQAENVQGKNEGDDSLQP